MRCALQLFMHGRQRVPWSKLAVTVPAGNTTMVVRDDTDWAQGDKIFVSSTDLQMLHAEEKFIKHVSSDGRTIELDKPLIYEHKGLDIPRKAQHGRCASVGLLTPNIVVQGDHINTQKDNSVPDRHEHGNKYGRQPPNRAIQQRRGAADGTG